MSEIGFKVATFAGITLNLESSRRNLTATERRVATEIATTLFDYLYAAWSTRCHANNSETASLAPKEGEQFSQWLIRVMFPRSGPLYLKKELGLYELDSLIKQMFDAAARTNQESTFLDEFGKKLHSHRVVMVGSPNGPQDTWPTVFSV